MVLAALGVAGWSKFVVGSVENMIDGTVCVLNDALFRFFCLPFAVDLVDKLGTFEVSAVAGNII